MNNAQPSPRQRVATATALIVQNVRQTHYQHEPVVIDPNTGTYELDCSEFVSYVLHGCVPEQYASVPKRPNAACPQAFEYCDYLRALTPDGANGWERRLTIDGALVFEPSRGWRPVALSDARRGDVIAWRLPHWKPGQDTGHVFLVAEKPVALSTDVVAVRGYDSSDVPHYDDSREVSGGFQTGVGMGTLHFRLNAAGAALAVQFGPGDRFHVVPIAIGRVEPLE